MSEDQQLPVQTNTQEPVVQPVAASTATSAPKTKKPMPKWLLPVIIVAGSLLVLGGGAYGYLGVYMQTPENLWKQSVKNTGKGFADFVNQPMPTQTGAKVNGSFKLTAPVIADGTISGAYDDKSTQLTASAGLSGVRANLELKGITAANASTQDLYLKLDGLGSLGSLLGDEAAGVGELLSGIEGKWYVIDHTLLEEATASLNKEEAKTPSPQEIEKEVQELSKKFAVILNERLFTTDDKKAVVVVKEKLAKEDFKGRKSQHLKVQVRKDQLREMVVALKDATKGTKVADLIIGDSKKSLEEALDFDSLLKQIDNANYDNAVADVWLDTSLKYVRNVRIQAVDSVTKKSVGSVDFMLDYTGGDELPLSVTITNTESDSNNGSINLGMNINKKSYVIKLSAGVNGDFDRQNIQGTAELTVTPSNDKLTVEKPTGATNILELIGGLMGQSGSLQSQLADPTTSGADLSNLLDDFQLQ